MTDLFLHIPKTGGMSMQTALKWIYNPGSCCSLPTEFPLQPDQLRTALPAACVRRHDLIMGHFFYGLHRHFEGEFRYFTMLRDPVRRVVSHYYYNKARNPETALGSVPLDGFLESDSRIARPNRHVRFLSGVDPAESPQTALDIAKEHLSACAAFGITERFDESLLLFRRRLGWKAFPFYVRRKVNRERPTVDELPDDTLDAVRERNRLDIELYTFARKRFEQALDDEFANLDAALRQFRRWNVLFQSVAPPFIWLYRTTRGLYSQT